MSRRAVQPAVGGSSLGRSLAAVPCIAIGALPRWRLARHQPCRSSDALLCHPVFFASFDSSSPPFTDLLPVPRQFSSVAAAVHRRLRRVLFHFLSDVSNFALAVALEFSHSHPSRCDLARGCAFGTCGRRPWQSDSRSQALRFADRAFKIAGIRGGLLPDFLGTPSVVRQTSNMIAVTGVVRGVRPMTVSRRSLGPEGALIGRQFAVGVFSGTPAPLISLLISSSIICNVLFSNPCHPGLRAPARA